MIRFLTSFLGISLVATSLFADGPEDNLPDQVRRIPPPGIEVPPETSAALRKGLGEVAQEIAGLRVELAGEPDWLALLPDVEVYHKAVRYGFEFREFQKEGELEVALGQLETAMQRAAELRQRKASWLRQTGPVVRGFRSRIDGSVQPYGLEIPENYDFDDMGGVRLDLWFHGRGEKVNEVAFIQQRTRGGGKISPVDTIVLHPYARYSNANKFAGEIDCLEALEHAGSYLRIDEDRTFVRGFSMGGAACWQFAVHYADRWAGATPGAGFSETPDFLRTFQGETLDPSPWEERLWRWYDCTDWAINLTNCPTIAYSGELDRQKQAADKMEAAMEKLGLKLVHLIGPGMGHKYHPDSSEEIERRLTNIARSGRQRVPLVVRFQTYTLRYNRMHWLTIDRMTEHWEPARIDGEFAFPNAIFLTTSGVERFTVELGAGDCPLDPGRPPIAEINGRAVECPPIWSDRGWKVTFQQGKEGDWTVVEPESDSTGLSKRHGLTGPIDDAFMDSFIMVKPSRAEWLNEDSRNWTENELDHAVTHWRQQMRGDARVKSDEEVTEQDIADHHLVLWGDPRSNGILARIIGELPVTWNDSELAVGDQSFDATKHTLAMIYPNPLNPDRYVVINSSFTYREYDYLNNARQTPKLPDWAVIDLTAPPTSRAPGKISVAGFFDEEWEVK